MADGQVEDVQDVTEPEDLEAQIERTRDDLASTIDAIADRVSPKRVATRGLASAKDGARSALASVQQRVARMRHGEPEPVADADGITTFEVRRRPPTGGVLAGAVAAGGVLLTVLLRRRSSSGKRR